MKMIRLSGCSLRDGANPHGDIAIDVVGLRPGEKLYEELLIDGEATGTAHPRIWQAREDGVNATLLESALRGLEDAIRATPQEVDVREMLTRWVAGYTGQGAGMAAIAPGDGRQRMLH